jgi:hypothetical protein
VGPEPTEAAEPAVGDPEPVGSSGGGAA